MKNYPAKLLLFGEHTVNLGSQALAVPLPLFSGKWVFAKHLNPSELAARQLQLPQFADYLDRLQQRGELLAILDVTAFRQALAEGLVFESNIPTGYGAGSSGALVAGVYDSWQLAVAPDLGRRQSDIVHLKKALAQLEAFFHGTSSGTDPLVCFLQKPVLLGGAAGAQIVQQSDSRQLVVEPPTDDYQIFLLDTGIARQATTCIEYFLEKMLDEAFAEHCRKSLVPSVEAAIAGYLAGDGQSVFEEVHRIGEFQLRNLAALIPEPFRPIWQQGLDGDLFGLKLCGAGGGGFILGITPDFEKTTRALTGQKLMPVLGV